jgi:uncharacterized glyoxalase superfamily metalloenzyme YdcJ
MSAPYVRTDDIRKAFSTAMSDMYRAEVALYGELIEIVQAINMGVLEENPALATELAPSDKIDGLNTERHGAVRVGTAEELSLMRRAFAVMGMHPVGYYDLAAAGVPVHSTAFRPLDLAALTRSPFRVFTSLLRLELIEDAELRGRAKRILAGRRIFSNAAVSLIERCEMHGGLRADEADRFVAAVLETFRWRGEAIVDAATYRSLHEAHRLVADIVSFPGPHINHLTPRVLDIDAAQAEMARRGIDAKSFIEGPPRRAFPILLRQTSFKALEEKIRFHGNDEPRGIHTARFGEIEQRGVALTLKGRALYDALLNDARSDQGPEFGSYEDRLTAAFERFPDSASELRRQGLAYFHYRISDDAGPTGGLEALDIDTLVTRGTVVAEPVIYQDFLPVSAAGIFRSNLDGELRPSFSTNADLAGFEAALGARVHDPFALYSDIERESVAAVRTALCSLNGSSIP